MTRRLGAALLAVAAVGLHVGVAVPFRRSRDESRREWAEAREEREILRSRLSRLERRAAARPAPSGDAAAARAMRQSLLRAAEGLPLAAVRIGVEAGRRGAVAARGRLSAEGAKPDLLRAAERLADPSSGVLLERVTLLPTRGGELRLEVHGLSLRAEPEAGP